MEESRIASMISHTAAEYALLTAKYTEEMIKHYECEKVLTIMDKLYNDQVLLIHTLQNKLKKFERNDYYDCPPPYEK